MIKKTKNTLLYSTPNEEMYACMDVPGMEMWKGQILKQDCSNRFRAQARKSLIKNKHRVTCQVATEAQ